MKIISLTLAAALLASGTAAAAQSASDARCILLANAFAGQSKEANQQKMAEDSLYFYLGRISVQATATQLKTLLDAQAKTINNDNAGALMGECAKAVQAKVQLMETIAAQSRPPQQQQPAKPKPNPQGR